MKSFDDAASVAASARAHPDPQLRQLLADAVQDWAACELLHLTHLLIVEPGDTLEAIEQQIGFTPLVNPLDGSCVGSPGFTPGWDHSEDHGGWFELIFTVGNDGFAFVLFIQDAEGAQPELLRLCRAHSGEGA